MPDISGTARRKAPSFEEFLAENAGKMEPTQKLGYMVYAHPGTEPGTEIYNVKEHAHYSVTPETPYVMSGQDGEQWPVTEKAFKKTYEIAGKPLGNGFVPAMTKSGNPCLAVQIPRGMALDVPTSWGDVMHANAGTGPQADARHGTGDFLVMDAGADGKPVPGTQRVIEFETFGRTYEPVRGSEPFPVREAKDVPVPPGFYAGPEAGWKRTPEDIAAGRTEPVQPYRIVMCGSEEQAKELMAEGGVTATVEFAFGDRLYGSPAYDHHGSRSDNPSPCNDPAVRTVPCGTFAVNHLDADCIGGLMALMGKKPDDPEFWKAVEYADVNGPQHVRDLSPDLQDKLNAFYAWNYKDGKEHPEDRQKGTVPADVTKQVMRAAGAFSAILGERGIDEQQRMIREGREWREGLDKAMESKLVFENEYLRAFITDGISCSGAYWSEKYGKNAPATLVYNEKFGSISLAFFDGGKDISASKFMKELFGPGAGGRDGIAGTPRGQRYTPDDFMKTNTAVDFMMMREQIRKDIIKTLPEGWSLPEPVREYHWVDRNLDFAAVSPEVDLYTPDSNAMRGVCAFREELSVDWKKTVHEGLAEDPSAGYGTLLTDPKNWDAPIRDMRDDPEFRRQYAGMQELAPFFDGRGAREPYEYAENDRLTYRKHPYHEQESFVALREISYIPIKGNEEMCAYAVSIEAIDEKGSVGRDVRGIARTADIAGIASDRSVSEIEENNEWTLTVRREGRGEKTIDAGSAYWTIRDELRHGRDIEVELPLERGRDRGLPEGRDDGLGDFLTADGRPGAEQDGRDDAFADFLTCSGPSGGRGDDGRDIFSDFLVFDGPGQGRGDGAEMDLGSGRDGGGRGDDGAR